VLSVDAPLVVSVIALAVALASAVTAILVFRQSSLIYGRRRPIVISAPRAVDPYGDLNAPTPRTDAAPRIAPIYMFNRSGIPQHFVVDEKRSRVLKPVLGAGALPRSIDFEPHAGGNVSLTVSCRQDVWPKDISGRGEMSDQRYLLRIIGTTQSGHTTTWTGWVELWDPYWRG
jgi:hypothetical protein